MFTNYIKVVLNDLTNKGYEVLYIGAFGSFNYGLETDNSDYDMKAIVNFNVRSLYTEKDKNMIEYKFGQCEVMNLIEFGKKLSNFELPYLEVLFSQINYISERFDCEKLRNVVNDALINNRNFLSLEIIKTMEKIDKTFMKSNVLDFKGKKTYNIIRLYNLFKKFNACKKYAECLHMSEDVDKMMNHKLGRISKDEANEDCDEYISKMCKYKNMKYTEIKNKRERINDLVIDMFEMLLREKVMREEKRRERRRKRNCLIIEKTSEAIDLPLNEKYVNVMKYMYVNVMVVMMVMVMVVMVVMMVMM